jgi:D-lactate dehydrogenase
MLTGPYLTLCNTLRSTIPDSRLIHDELRLLAYGTDASFYRLIPKLVVKVESEEDVVTVLREARALKLPLTFRAAGTSLSGQAISDSVLVMLGSSWTKYKISSDASTITLQPAVIGGHANIFLAPYGKKIGPDPASINAAMVGGIAANNSSGMCCGTAQNSYRTLASMRIIFADGSTLDTGSNQSRGQFSHSHQEMVGHVQELSRRTKQNESLAERIRRKFKMKNTTGYSLNALVDYDEPIDIIQHLMIGSEGTLGFIAEITYKTVPEYQHKASCLMLFPNIETACIAVSILKSCNVEAVELMDRASLRSVENKDGMPGYFKSLDPEVAALLVETRAADGAQLSKNIESISSALASLQKVRPFEFTVAPDEFAKLWNIRKGLFPSVGAMRSTGTTVIIEDIVFPVPRLADGTLELQQLFARHGYADAIIFGHALEGNLHFVFSQDFNSSSEVSRYERFMDELATMVVKKYDGALKAEHGTGRNMAPFVELEWGSEAYALMKEIKNIFDPDNLLNPGVVINSDPFVHVKNLKPLPAADAIVDKCIECGFCEVQCPSRTLTLTPRQRIVAYREMSRLKATGESEKRLRIFEESFEYFGEETCATDGLCATSCPVTIDTGKLVKQLRIQTHSPLANWIASFLAHNMAFTTASVRVALNFVNGIHSLLGTTTMINLSTSVRRLFANKIPQWNPAMPKGADPLPLRRYNPSSAAQQVVYFPSCINRTMGVAQGYDEAGSLVTSMHKLLTKARTEIIIPEGVSNLCCGLAFSSKGFKKQGDEKADELSAALLNASHNGEIPILSDTSPCLQRMKETLDKRLKLYEPIEFILNFVVDKLEIKKLDRRIAIHNTCSSTKMGLNDNFKCLAEMCATEVVVPFNIGCCGWAGDRGFSHPELNEAALSNLKACIPGDCTHGYSTSRTCEIGLSLHSGINYKSIVYLVERCSTPKDTEPRTVLERA